MRPHIRRQSATNKYIYAGVAQLAVYSTCNRVVASSTLAASSTKFFDFFKNLLYNIYTINKEIKITYGLLVQLVRTLACHARGQRFKSAIGRHNSGLMSADLSRDENHLRC